MTCKKMKFKNLDFDRIKYDAENGDVFAIYKLARLYDIGAIEDASDSKYIYWFKKFLDSKEINAVLVHLEEKYEENNCADSIIDTILIQDSIKKADYDIGIMDELVLRGYIIEAGLSLGLYYMNSTDEIELANAERYISDALTANRDYYLVQKSNKEYDLFDILTRIQYRIARINKKTQPIIEIKNGTSVEAWIEEKIGKIAWAKLREESKTDIITAIECYLSFNDYTDQIDYASSIIPIMKAIEHELRVRFYDHYVEYLKNNYADPKSYVHANYPDAEDYEGIAKRDKSKVIKYYKESKRLRYVNTEKEESFTFGNFRSTISCGEWEKARIDRTVIDYCKKELFPDVDIGDDRVEKWLISLLEGVYAQRRVRNESAHGGKIQKIADSEMAIKEIITEGKLLARIVHPPFLD